MPFELVTNDDRWLAILQAHQELSVQVSYYKEQRVLEHFFNSRLIQTIAITRLHSLPELALALHHAV